MLDEAFQRSRSTILVAAHPDDEVLGAGSQLSSWPSLTLVHVTDGAPRNMYDASRHGFACSGDYARARRAELADALRAGGVEPDDLIEFGISDQDVCRNIPATAAHLADLFAKLSPDLILTHPYEGGHPDHDSCALAVNLASRLTGCAGRVYEFTSYHAWNGQMRTGEFLGNGAAFSIELTEPQSRRKRAMLNCFRTQQETLSPFRTDRERFRKAPSYDFTNPPHPGTLHYENFDWGLTGVEFCALARRAIQESVPGGVRCD